MKKPIAYFGLVIFIVGLIMLSYGIYGHDNANGNNLQFWSWVEFIGFIFTVIGIIILLFWIKSKLNLKVKTKFYIGLILIINGIVTNAIYYYFSSQGLMVTGLVGLFIMASASPLFLLLYFAVGIWLVYRNRPMFWID